MAKDKKSLKVPKRIAGVKVPKEIRKPVNKALKMAENPQARGLAIAALTAAAGALAEPPGDAAARRPRKPGEPGTDDRAGTLADIAIAAALDGARRLLDGLEAAAAPDEQPPARPKRGRPPSARTAAAARPAGE